MFPARSAYVKLELTRARIRIASFHSASDCARIMRRNCSPPRILAVVGRAQDVDSCRRRARSPGRAASASSSRVSVDETGAVLVLDASRSRAASGSDAPSSR